MGVELVYEPYPDRRKAQLKKATNLKEGDYVRFRRKDNLDTAVDGGEYIVKDKDGADVKWGEMIAVGRPRELNEQKKAYLAARNKPLSREVEDRNMGVRNSEELNAKNKKIFNMGGTK